MNRLRAYLSQPINNAGLAVWRVAFGTLMLVESWGAIATGWVKSNLVEPNFTFSFIGFEWLHVFLGYPMYVYFFIMGCAALCVALGYKYRYATVLLALLWSGAYFLQKTSYNNHYYLAVLLCWWMAVLPANRRLAIDASQSLVTGFRQNMCRKWIAVFAKAQLLIVFTYGSIAKFYPGWLNGDFIAQSFKAKAGYPVIGPWLQVQSFQDFITYGAIVFDGLVIPLLLWKPTRKFAFLGLIGFNLFNSVVFQIGIFPYLVLAMTVFFFEPSYIETLFRLNKTKSNSEGYCFSNGASIKPLTSVASVCFIGYFIIQILLPLRHHAIPGDVNWTEEGHRLSWRMMLRAKRGRIVLEAKNPVTGEQKIVRARDYLTPKQAQRLPTKPYFVYRFAQHVEDTLRAKGWEEVEVYVKRSRVYLNGKGPKALFDPTVDLTSVAWNYWGRNSWVEMVELEE